MIPIKTTRYGEVNRDEQSSSIEYDIDVDKGVTSSTVEVLNLNKNVTTINGRNNNVRSPSFSDGVVIEREAGGKGAKGDERIRNRGEREGKTKDSRSGYFPSSSFQKEGNEVKDPSDNLGDMRDLQMQVDLVRLRESLNIILDPLSYQSKSLFWEVTSFLWNDTLQLSSFCFPNSCSWPLNERKDTKDVKDTSLYAAMHFVWDHFIFQHNMMNKGVFEFRKDEEKEKGAETDTLVGMIWKIVRGILLDSSSVRSHSDKLYRKSKKQLALQATKLMLWLLCSPISRTRVFLFLCKRLEKHNIASGYVEVPSIDKYEVLLVLKFMNHILNIIEKYGEKAFNVANHGCKNSRKKQKEIQDIDESQLIRLLSTDSINLQSTQLFDEDNRHKNSSLNSVDETCFLFEIHWCKLICTHNLLITNLISRLFITTIMPPTSNIENIETNDNHKSRKNLDSCAKNDKITEKNDDTIPDQDTMGQNNKSELTEDKSKNKSDNENENNIKKEKNNSNANNEDFSKKAKRKDEMDHNLTSTVNVNEISPTVFAVTVVNFILRYYSFITSVVCKCRLKQLFLKSTDALEKIEDVEAFENLRDDVWLTFPSLIPLFDLLRHWYVIQGKINIEKKESPSKTIINIDDLDLLEEASLECRLTAIDDLRNELVNTLSLSDNPKRGFVSERERIFSYFRPLFQFLLPEISEADDKCKEDWVCYHLHQIERSYQKEELYQMDKVDGGGNTAVLDDKYEAYLRIRPQSQQLNLVLGSVKSSLLKKIVCKQFSSDTISNNIASVVVEEKGKSESTGWSLISLLSSLLPLLRTSSQMQLGRDIRSGFHKSLYEIQRRNLLVSPFIYSLLLLQKSLPGSGSMDVASFVLSITNMALNLGNYTNNDYKTLIFDNLLLLVGRMARLHTSLVLNKIFVFLSTPIDTNKIKIEIKYEIVLAILTGYLSNEKVLDPLYIKQSWKGKLLKSIFTLMEKTEVYIRNEAAKLLLCFDFEDVCPTLLFRLISKDESIRSAASRGMELFFQYSKCPEVFVDQLLFLLHQTYSSEKAGYMKILKIPESFSSSDADTNCSFCGKAQASKRCARCKSRYYCSLPCQQKDWTLGHHKDSCEPVSPSCVTTKSMNKGEIFYDRVQFSKLSIETICKSFLPLWIKHLQLKCPHIWRHFLLETANLSFKYPSDVLPLKLFSAGADLVGNQDEQIGEMCHTFNEPLERCKRSKSNCIELFQLILQKLKSQIIVFDSDTLQNKNLDSVQRLLFERMCPLLLFRRLPVLAWFWMEETKYKVIANEIHMEIKKRMYQKAEFPEVRRLSSEIYGNFPICSWIKCSLHHLERMIEVKEKAHKEEGKVFLHDLTSLDDQQSLDYICKVDVYSLLIGLNSQSFEKYSPYCREVFVVLIKLLSLPPSDDEEQYEIQRGAIEVLTSLICTLAEHSENHEIRNDNIEKGGCLIQEIEPLSNNEVVKNKTIKTTAKNSCHDYVYMLNLLFSFVTNKDCQYLIEQTCNSITTTPLPNPNKFSTFIASNDSIGGNLENLNTDFETNREIFDAIENKNAIESSSEIIKKQRTLLLSGGKLLVEDPAKCVCILNVLIGSITNISLEPLLRWKEHFGFIIYASINSLLCLSSTAMDHTCMDYIPIDQSTVLIITCWTRLLFTFLYRIEDIPFKGCTIEDLFSLVSRNLDIGKNRTDNDKVDLYELRFNTVKLIGGILVCINSIGAETGNVNASIILLRIKTILTSMCNIDSDGRLRKLAEEILASSFSQ